jgi:hypothetical protein
VAVDIGIEDPDLLPLPRERGRQIHRQRRLADPSLAAGNRDHARRAVERDPLRALGDAAAELRRQGRLLLGRHDIEVERHPLDARNRRERLGHLLLEARPKRAAGHGEGDRHGDTATVDRDVPHHVELDDAAPELWVDHALEGGPDLVARRFHADERSNTKRSHPRPVDQRPFTCGARAKIG